MELQSLLLRDIQLGGKAYKVPTLMPNCALPRPKHELSLLPVFKTILSSTKGAVIDVGANSGQTFFTILKLDPTRRYIGFEPLAYPAACIATFIAMNELRNAQIFPLALSDRTGILQLYVRGDGLHLMSSSCASVVPKFRPSNFYSTQFTVPCERGDSLLALLNIESVALIKLDVEGGELEVLRGLQNTVSLHTPYILFEVLNHYIVTSKRRLGTSFIELREKRLAELISLFGILGYDLNKISNEGKFSPITEISPTKERTTDGTNYLAIHKSRKELR